MNVLVAPAQFKESMKASDAAECWGQTLTDVGISSNLQPISDGGEGFVDAFLFKGGREVQLDTFDALGRPISASYAVKGKTAIIEMARASGLELISPVSRNPERSTTYGTGLLIRHAIENSYNKLIVGMGGSATNDGGLGIFRALGGKILNAQDEEVSLPIELTEDCRLDTTALMPSIPTCIGATDVRNPLLGAEGATAVYGPQKGVEDIAFLEYKLNIWADLIEGWRQQSFRNIAGSGAAGGLGFGLLGVLNATLQPGFDIVVDVTGLADSINQADVVVTGEGRMDQQSSYGKATFGIMQLSKTARKPVYAIVGKVESGLTHDFDGVYELSDLAGSSEEAMKNPEFWMRKAMKLLISDLTTG